MKNTRIYFPNLHGLRFIAASLVIVHHIEQIKSMLGMDNYWSLRSIEVIGKLGIVLFFVLSGFLITYLLLEEEHLFNKIDIPKFYLRRVLRIWPLYFLTIILAFWVFPNVDALTLPHYGKDVIYQYLTWKIFLYGIICPNVALSLLGVVPYASHTWSIGTEEQYYIIWPLLLKYFRKYRSLIMYLIIALCLIVTWALGSVYTDFLPYKRVIKAFWSTFNIDCMAIGGLYALLLFKKGWMLKFFLNAPLFYIVLIAMVVLILTGTYFPYFHNEIYAILFGILILNFSTPGKMVFSLENKVLTYLGNISYGLYMYHPVAIAIALVIVSRLDLMTNWVIYPLTFFVTILSAGVSYKYFEGYFLKFKSRFEHIITTKK